MHFADPDFYDILYSSKSRYSKIDHLKYRFGTPTASFDTTDHAHHARRRGAMNPFFSRQRILNYAPYAQSRVERLCKRLENEYKGTSKVFCFNDAWASLTTDVINYYSFAMSYDFQDYPDFVAPFTKSIKLLAQSLHLVGHFPWILSILQSLPDSVVGILNPAMVPVFQFQNVSVPFSNNPKPSLIPLRGRKSPHKSNALFARKRTVRRSRPPTIRLCSAKC